MRMVTETQSEWEDKLSLLVVHETNKKQTKNKTPIFVRYKGDSLYRYTEKQ